MSSLTSSTPARMLEAAHDLFALHGFQRTSMADIAQAAGVSRASLYLHFKDKTALFGSLAETMVARALEAAEAAWDEQDDLCANIAATILARDLPLFRLLHASPHGAEMLRVDAALTESHARRLEQGFTAILERRAQALEAAGADLSAFGGAAGFAAFLSSAGAGLKHEMRTEAAYRGAVDRLAAVAARASRAA